MKLAVRKPYLRWRDSRSGFQCRISAREHYGDPVYLGYVCLPKRLALSSDEMEWLSGQFDYRVRESHTTWRHQVVYVRMVGIDSEIEMVGLVSALAAMVDETLEMRE